MDPPFCGDGKRVSGKGFKLHPVRFPLAHMDRLLVAAQADRHAGSAVFCFCVKFHMDPAASGDPAIQILGNGALFPDDCRLGAVPLLDPAVSRKAPALLIQGKLAVINGIIHVIPVYP